MTNKEIAKSFQFLGQLMELHQENKFKIRSYQNAYITIRKLPTPLAEMSDEEIQGVKGIGKAIAGKIRELLDHGQMATLERYKEQTPEGVQEMLQIKGFGPKKILVIWKELEVETIGELLYAVNENRLVELKGFGAKTQEDLRQKLEYHQATKHQFHYAVLAEAAASLLAEIKAQFPQQKIEFTGALRRAANVVEQISFLMEAGELVVDGLKTVLEEVEQVNDQLLQGKTANELPVQIHLSSSEDWARRQFELTAHPSFLEAIDGYSSDQEETETSIFEKYSLPYIVPELRESSYGIDFAQSGQMEDLVELTDIQGVVHNHSTYSDGMQSIKEMALYAKDQGYSYLVMTDHSKSAFYANGLKEDRVLAQFAEIEQLNQEIADFTILKGIESDILNNGDLDYDDDLLAQFDVVIASVHSNLRMDEQKATQRLLQAIQNPYTHILGHPTGRLLLSRKGYPIDHQVVIDACAEHKVSIELNANPYRLDLDWTWIPYAMEKGVQISINPDAHSTSGIHHIKYGVVSARKGGLTKSKCLNAKPMEAFLEALKK